MIAHCLYLTADIEKWGSGLKRINQECDLAHVPVKFEVLKYGYRVVFSRIKSQNSPPEGGVTGGVTGLLLLIKENPGLRLPQLAEQLQKPKDTVDKWLRKLKANGKIIFRGAPKTGGYFAK